MDARCIFCESHTEGLSFCTACNSKFCESCWPRWPLHKNNIRGADGLPHEKVNLSVVEGIKECMQEPDNTNEIQLHQDDDETTWFGFERDESGEPVLQEYRRYASVVMQSAGDRACKRYPSLVSFIGRTGAGKSSVIKLLIDLGAEQGDGNQSFEGPVIGRSESSVPTSADVHLYLSPSSASPDNTILYADCEGFEGAERNPVAVAAVASGRNAPDKYGSDPSVMRHLRKISQGTRRVLKWANREHKDYEKVSKRGYTVAQMYPRIFYAFSDVIVWVLETPRTLESIVERLLVWADENYSRTLNQPIKPHVIIAFNKSNNQTPDDQWSEVNATANLLDAADAQIHQNPTFVRFAQRWKHLHYRVDTMKKLLECYYSTVHVVRIPQKDRYHMVHQQRQVLHRLIMQCCGQARVDKEERGLLTDVDEFGMYLSLAFDHFSETLDKPFDFVEASLLRNPVSASLGSDILFFVRVMAVRLRSRSDIRRLFTSLTSFIASCILLRAARKKHIGRPEDWFGGWETEKSLQSDGKYTKSIKRKPGSYRDICYQIVSGYFKRHLPCRGTVKTGIFGAVKPCTMVQAVHGPEHRISSDGSAWSPGDFKWRNDFEVNSWDEDVLTELNLQYGRLDRTGGVSYRKSVALMHKFVCTTMYRSPDFQDMVDDDNESHSLCLACLWNPPQYQLSCGHLLCLECCRDFGEVQGRKITVTICPLHKTQTLYENAPAPLIISMPPQYSGLRVLTLDGGGVRGIVEICILEAIENFIGLPIQKFIDLVIGTSTGGIVALALGNQMMPVEECKRLFQRLAESAFTLRAGQKLQVIKQLQVLLKHSRYETKPLEQALWQAFGVDAKLFPRTFETERLRTAVIATTGTGTQAKICANYNTRPDPNARYTHHRPFNPGWELAVWEAARATSAAPGFFKPFVPAADRSRPEFMDGAILHNNPVEVALTEVMALSEEEELSPTPDLVLSLGTGLSDIARSHYVSERPISKVGVHHPKTALWLSKMFFIVQYQVKLNIDAESRWKRIEGSRPDLKNRLFRLNPDFGKEPPELDDVDAMPGLLKDTNNLLSVDRSLIQTTRKAACALVASSFYFEKSNIVIVSRLSRTELRGHIKCRLEDPADIKKLGHFIRKAYQPQFVISSQPEYFEDLKKAVDFEVMIARGTFLPVETSIHISGDGDVTKIELRLPGICDNNRSHFPISGFPRQLMKMDFKPA